jgi:predicted nucleic acid-binding protein
MVTYLVDTSVWAGFFRNRGTPANQQLDALIDADPRQIRGCPPVRMELAVDPDDLRRRRLLRTYDGFLSTDVMSDDFDLAAEIYRMARRYGHTIRSQLDCVIAAIAMRVNATLVHNDIDFDRMGEVVPELAVLRLPDS